MTIYILWFSPFIFFVSYAIFHIFKLSLCQPGPFLWICLLVQKLLQYLWLISSSYAFLVGKFLMSIISVEFGSHCLSFICPFLFVSIFEYQGFFKKNRSLIWSSRVILSFPKENPCWHLASTISWHITLFQLWLRWFRVYLWPLEGQVYF